MNLALLADGQAAPIDGSLGDVRARVMEIIRYWMVGEKQIANALIDMLVGAADATTQITSLEEHAAGLAEHVDALEDERSQVQVVLEAADGEQDVESLQSAITAALDILT